MGGYFGKNRRIRAQRFRGEISEGFWVPLSYFDHLGVTLKEGQRFSELGGHTICQKYITPATRRAMQAQPKKAKAIQALPKHYDTPQLRENVDRISPSSLVFITEKLHGTSARTGYVKTSRPWYLRWLGPKYVRISGTRNCILDEQAPGEKGQSYRQRWHNAIAPKLRKGEVVYYEIVGYDTSGRLIMPSHGYGSTDLPKGEVARLAKLYGDAMKYDYGCRESTSAAYVYRITLADRELTWPEVVKRSEELGLPTPPLLEVSLGTTLERCNELTRGSTELGSVCIKEGICLREEPLGGAPKKALKHKSWLFCALEGIRRNDEDYVDTEEIA